MDRAITLYLPEGLDDLIHVSGIGQMAPAVTDELRRLYVVAILAAVVTGLEAPGVAEALVRLNGGEIFLLPNRRVH